MYQPAPYELIYYGRMTGGGTGRCLQTTEARGLGEGWSDALASWLEKVGYSLYGQ
jgi:hypothetical protein